MLRSKTVGSRLTARSLRSFVGSGLHWSRAPRREMPHTTASHRQGGAHPRPRRRVQLRASHPEWIRRRLPKLQSPVPSPPWLSAATDTFKLLTPAYDSALAAAYGSPDALPRDSARCPPDYMRIRSLIESMNEAFACLGAAMAQEDRIRLAAASTLSCLRGWTSRRSAILGNGRLNSLT